MGKLFLKKSVQILFHTSLYVQQLCEVLDFNFLRFFTYGVCKKRKYCNRMSEKKILSFWQMFMIFMS